jgi:hypothetical protein
MGGLRAGWEWAVALTGMSLLAACDRGVPVTRSEAAASAADTASSAAAPPPVAGVTPKVDDVSASGPAGTGPAEGATAVGGLAARQDTGGTRHSGTPAPTGGDAAPSATSK